MATKGEDHEFEGILPSQMKTFVNLVEGGYINRQEFQNFLDQFPYREIYYDFPEPYRRANQILGKSFIGIEHVVNSLQWKGINIMLTESELEEYSLIPIPEKTLVEVAAMHWRERRAILWWAPPERYGFTLRNMLKIFGTNRKHQPCFYENNWWIEKDFACEVLQSGWHLTLVELPFETQYRNLSEQISLKEDHERPCKPIELVFLSFIHFILYGERILRSFYSRTDKNLCNYTVSLGNFSSEGFHIDRIPSSLRTQDNPIGLLFERSLS